MGMSCHLPRYHYVTKTGMMIHRKTEMLRHTNTEMLMHQKTHKHRDVDAEEDSDVETSAGDKEDVGRWV